MIARSVYGAVMELRVSPDAAAAADAAGAWLAHRARDAVRRRGRAHLAVSGGSTAPPMLAALAAAEVAWEAVTLWQVDERVAPDGDPDRNAGQLVGFPAEVRLMPVTSDDLPAACRRYAQALPEVLDAVHLGIGDDGHTASWPPGDPVVDSTRRCEIVGEFHGRRRMTLTPRVVNGARARLVLVVGASKADVVRRWLLRDPSLPIDRVRRSRTVVMLDADAASALPADLPAILPANLPASGASRRRQ